MVAGRDLIELVTLQSLLPLYTIYYSILVMNKLMCYV